MDRLKLTTKPWKHQLEALRYFMKRSYGALYTDMGSGKTKIMVDLIVNKGWKRVLIVCPKRVGQVWQKEVSKHAPQIAGNVFNLIEMSGDKKVATLKQNQNLTSKIVPQVVIINYDSIWREPLKTFLLSKLKIDCVICDESHRIKGAGSKSSKMLQLLGRRVQSRFLMTGTVLAQSPLDVYAQYRFLAPEIFGTRYETFKYEYANWVQIPGGFSVIDKKNPYKNLDKLHDKMFSCAFKTDSEVELPETQDIEVEFDISPKAEYYYSELQEEGCLELSKGVVDATTVLTKILRLQQLCNGYLPTEDEEGNKSLLKVDEERKDTFKALLEDIPPDEPVVVFAKFRKDITNIRNAVRDLGRKSSELSGKRNTLDNWLEGRTSVLVIQISSGAEGIDLTRARYCVYYSMTTSLSQYLQSRKRVHRPGQTRNVVYYTLVARLKKGVSIDRRIMNALQANKNVIDSIMEVREL